MDPSHSAGSRQPQDIYVDGPMSSVAERISSVPAMVYHEREPNQVAGITIAIAFALGGVVKMAVGW